jgi:phosphonate transport system substrate-binding protein
MTLFIPVHTMPASLPVKHGRGDAATVADHILTSAVDEGIIGKDEYKAIWRSESIPGSPMV